MYNILLVDDEPGIRDLIKKYASFEGYTIIEAENGIDGIEKFGRNNIDIIVMDVMMPELDGFSAVKEIRKQSNVPVIMLSARGEEYDRILGFELGVDDYVSKPFSPKELLMRIEAIMKRIKPQEEKREIFKLEDLKIDFDARRVEIGNKEIELSPKEYELLFYMVRNHGIALTREKLISDIWGFDFYGDDRTLDTHIKLLRKSLGDYAKFIVTLRGVGYRFGK